MVEGTPDLLLVIVPEDDRVKERVLVTETVAERVFN